MAEERASGHQIKQSKSVRNQRTPRALDIGRRGRAGIVSMQRRPKTNFYCYSKFQGSKKGQGPASGHELREIRCDGSVTSQPNHIKPNHRLRTREIERAHVGAQNRKNSTKFTKVCVQSRYRRSILSRWGGVYKTKSTPETQRWLPQEHLGGALCRFLFVVQEISHDKHDGVHTHI